MLYIGKNDNGEIVGLSDKDRKKLLESIPNKITDTMGIVADVNLMYENGLQYIEIIVDKYPSLISYHGKYFYRSGSTMRTITGKELDKAILKSQGRTWDGMPIPKLQVADLRKEAIDLFKEKALRRHRLTDEETRVDDAILMENLHLFDGEGYLIRAAMLAFYKDPEKWVTGAYIKIGYFGKSDADFIYQDEVHGSLIEQFMFPQEAFREILLNAVVHRDYQQLGAVYVKHYPDKIVIENPGGFLDGITEKNIITHPSVPRNKLIAETLQRLKYVQRTGQGVDIIFREMVSMGKPYPIYRVFNDAVQLTIASATEYVDFVKFIVNEQDTKQIFLSLSELMILRYVADNRQIKLDKAQELTQVSEDEVRKSLASLIKYGLLETSGKDYMLTARVYEAVKSDVEYTREKTVQYIRAKDMILEYLKINGSIKNSTIRELCGFTKQQARATIDKLIAENLIFKVGAGSATEYKLK